MHTDSKKHDTPTDANNVLAAGLSRQQAKEILDAGEKLTHKLMLTDEWVKKADNGMIETEDGYQISPLIFWSDRRGSQWDNGWYIWQSW